MKLRAPKTMRLLCLGMTLAVMGARSVPVSRAASADGSCKVPPATSPIYAGVAEQSAPTPRGPLGYYRFGHGTPILLVTGFGATLSEWNAAFLVELARGHEVVVFDNRGIGRSIPTARRFTVEDMARDTSALIHALHLLRSTVIGWSMGGAIVERLAIDDPAAVGRIVLLSALAPGSTGVPVPSAILAKLSGGAGATFHEIMALLFTPASVSQAERCFVQEEYKPADYTPPGIPQAVVAGQLALLTDWTGDETAASALAKLPVPTLILSGTEDAIVSPRNAQALQRLMPKARDRSISGGGHAMMYQDPISLARVITAFAGD